MAFLAKHYYSLFWWALAGLMALSPLAFGSVHPWAYKTITAVIFMLLALWLLRVRERRGFSRARNPFMVFFPLSALFFILQVVPLPSRALDAVSPGRAALMDAAGAGGAGTLALYAWAARGQALFLFAALLLFLMAVNFIRTREAAQRVVLTAAAAGTVTALTGFFFAAASGERRFLPFINRNQYAGFMEIIIPVALSCGVYLLKARARGKGIRHALSTRDGTVAAALVFSAVLMMSAVFASASRGGIISMAFSLAVLGALTARKKSYSLAALAASALLFVSILAVTEQNVAARRIMRLADIKSDESAALRVKIWHDTAGMIRAFPVMGAGLGCFETAFPSFKTIRMDKNFYQPESDYLYLLAEGGAAGSILAAAFLAVFLRAMLRRPARDDDPFAQAVSAGALSSLAALLLHGLVDINFHVPSNLVMMTALMAAAYAVTGGRAGRGGAAVRRVSLGGPGRLLAGAGAAVSAVIALSSAAGAAGDIAFRSATADMAATPGASKEAVKTYAHALERLETAAMLDPGRAAPYFEEGMACSYLAEYSSAMEAMGAARPGLLKPEEYSRRALDSFREAIDKDPCSSFGHLMAGRTLVRGEGGLRAAGAEYRSAARLNPTSPRIKKELAAYYEKNGDAALAAKYRAELPGLDPEYNAVTITSLAPDAGTGAACIGDRVCWTAEAKAPYGELEYSFIMTPPGVDYSRQTGFTRANRWVWDTKDEGPGLYRFAVEVRGAGNTAHTRFYGYKDLFELKARDAGKRGGYGTSG